MLAKVILIDEVGLYEEYRFTGVAFRIASFYKDYGFYQYVAVEKIPICIPYLWYCLIRKTIITVFPKNFSENSLDKSLSLCYNTITK